MLDVRILRELHVESPTGAGGVESLSSASGLVRSGDGVFVVADDEHHLARFEVSGDRPGRRIPLFDGALPGAHEARKAVKPDCESLVLLPPFGAFPCGALLALGSGSRSTRYRAALLGLDAAGAAVGAARIVDFAAVFESLNESLGVPNIEGAFIRGDALCLLHRGNGTNAFDAVVEFGWPVVREWLVGRGPAPGPVSIVRMSLGAIDGVPLNFTDGAALPDGGWVFSAAAEDTADSYQDGRCTGSAIGRVDASGRIVSIERVGLDCKIEGVAASVASSGIELLMVTDADDRGRPSLLLGASLPS